MGYRFWYPTLFDITYCIWFCFAFYYTHVKVFVLEELTLRCNECIVMSMHWVLNVFTTAVSWCCTCLLLLNKVGFLECSRPDFWLLHCMQKNTLDWHLNSGKVWRLVAARPPGAMACLLYYTRFHHDLMLQPFLSWSQSVLVHLGHILKLISLLP